MPTAKPRINVTVSHGMYDVLTSLAELQGTSRAAIINDLLHASMPALQRVELALTALRERQRALEQESADVARMDREQMSLKMDEAEAMLAPLIADSLGVFERIVADAGKPTQPPHSNTGVTPSQPDTSSGGRKGKKAKGIRHKDAHPYGGQDNGTNGGQES